MIRFLADEDVASVLDLDELLDVVEDAFVKQGRGEVERPDRPHFPVGIGLDENDSGRALGTALTMPAAIHGMSRYATKLVAVHPDNEAQGLSTINAQIALTDAATGLPAAYMDGTRITNARTGCIGGLAARHLAGDTATVGIVGAGTQARWQARAIATAVDVDTFRVYSPSDSKHDWAADVAEWFDGSVEAVPTAADAVRCSDVVVTATTSSTPVFDGSHLEPGTLVVGVGAYTDSMQELDAVVFDRADHVFADVPSEVATVGDLQATALTERELIPLSDVFEGRAGRSSDDEILVVDSVGSAVLDAAASDHVLSQAADAGIGTVIEFD